MNTWHPISLENLQADIAADELLMSPEVLSLWRLVRMPAVKWQQHPWGDQGGGFWAVGLCGVWVIWYNDIEDGFNVSRYSTFGIIDEYECNDVDLHEALRQFTQRLAPPTNT